MNERFYSLAEQVGATKWNGELNGNSIDFSPTQFEKFVESIVEECAVSGQRAVDDGMAHGIRCLSAYVKLRIQEHFEGDEE